MYLKPVNQTLAGDTSKAGFQAIKSQIEIMIGKAIKAGRPGGSYSQAVVATNVFTVTIGVTMPNATYSVNVTPTVLLAAAPFYVTNKTTTTFDVFYVVGLTGIVAFDWSIA